MTFTLEQLAQIQAMIDAAVDRNAVVCSPLVFGHPGASATKTLWMREAGNVAKTGGSAGAVMPAPGWIRFVAWNIDVNAIGATGAMRLQVRKNNVAHVEESVTVAVGNGQEFHHGYAPGEYDFDQGDKIIPVRVDDDTSITTDDIGVFVYVTFWERRP